MSNVHSDMTDKGHKPGNTNHGALTAQAGSDALHAGREAALENAGFSKEQIAMVKEKVPDLQIKVLIPLECNATVHQTTIDAVELSKQTGSAIAFKLNSAVTVVLPGDTVEHVTSSHTASSETANQTSRRQTRETEAAKFRAEMEREYASLPQFLKEWVDRIEKKNFSRTTTIAIAKDAHTVATTLKTEKAIQAWYKSGSVPQGEHDPVLIGIHSDSSFGQMASLALAYLNSENPRRGGLLRWLKDKIAA